MTSNLKKGFKMNKKSFTVKTNDGLVWQVHAGYIAPDFVQAHIIKAKKRSDIGAGFSAQLSALCGELADKIKEELV
jgi:hypothetical protein